MNNKTQFPTLNPVRIAIAWGTFSIAAEIRLARIISAADVLCIMTPEPIPNNNALPLEDTDFAAKIRKGLLPICFKPVDNI